MSAPKKRPRPGVAQKLARTPSRKAKINQRAWEIHKANGHPKGYAGPCWGPLPAEREQAKSEVERA